MAPALQIQYGCLFSMLIPLHSFGLGLQIGTVRGIVTSRHLQCALLKISAVAAKAHFKLKH